MGVSYLSTAVIQYNISFESLLHGMKLFWKKKNLSLTI